MLVPSDSCRQSWPLRHHSRHNSRQPSSGWFRLAQARVLVRWQARLGVELALFGAATASLAVSGFPKLAVALAVAVAFHQGWRVTDNGPSSALKFARGAASRRD